MNEPIHLLKKVCMLGSYAAGKTSLVRHFVEGIFSEKYHITIGVKIDKKTIHIDGHDVKLMLWDIAGEEKNFTIPLSYLKGTHGFLLVMDGTRLSTYEQALDIHSRTIEEVGDIPFIVVINKNDLVDNWQLNDKHILAMQQKNWTIIQSSAKSGTGVEDAFSQLTQKMLSK